jgi:antitoxin (DNA-binding transcriptional repressor) of toxin-antitoxin stability system
MEGFLRSNHAVARVTIRQKLGKLPSTFRCQRAMPHVGSEPVELRFPLCQDAPMKQISISEFQANAEWWIRQAVLERQLVITEQGRPVAALTPVLLMQSGKSLPNREERISRRSHITTDSADYISEMRD